MKETRNSAKVESLNPATVVALLFKRATLDDVDGLVVLTGFDRDAFARSPEQTERLVREGLSRGSLVGIWALMIGAFTLTLGSDFAQTGTFQIIFSSPVSTMRAGIWRPP